VRPILTAHGGPHPRNRNGRPRNARDPTTRELSAYNPQYRAIRCPPRRRSGSGRHALDCDVGRVPQTRGPSPARQVCCLVL